MKTEFDGESEKEIDLITEIVIGAAIAVHKELGPGLLESAYEACLAVEMGSRGLIFERQKALPVVYKGNLVECGYRLDFVVEGVVILELKAVEELTSLHEAQLLSYLKLSGCSVGLLLNFHVRQLTKGLKRLVMNHPS